ncbi:MAG: primosomal protein N' [Ruthenibacterium sp.]
MALTAQIAVNSATFHFDKLYTYRVPAHLEQLVQVGSMVLVPFGRGSAKARMGVVLALDAAQADTPAQVKTLYDVAPERAQLSDELLRLVYYLKENTFCTYYEAVKAIIPYGAQYRAINEGAVPTLQKQIIRHTENVYARKAADTPKKLTAKQQLAWDALADGALVQSALEECGVTKNVLDRLCEKEILACAVQDKSTAMDSATSATPEKIVLSSAQQAAFDALNALRTAGKPAAALLHGVTSSGKTLVFLRLIQETVKAGRQALVLVPEISLTPQMIDRLKAYFGERVAVQHSALSHTERLLQWQQIQNGAADIVVGTRSAVFAPLQSIGVIIIDEEQEHTYHSESAPRYSAHEVAKQRALAHHALLLLASATPSTESYYAAKEGRYHLVELHERYGGMPLPQVRLVDMRTELAAGNAGAISGELQGEIEQNLRDGKQTILLLNRRGYKTVGMCTKCAEAIRCDACSVPMVYHKADGKLLCHYCGKSISPVPEICPKCGERIKYTGFGTQRVEEELAEKFPKARVLRMDADSTSRKNAHETMLHRFAAGEYDMMLGTQMVAKGLDFERVTLVGVLGIDQLLFAQGYKAFENVFSLVTQVVGRGGRTGTPGRAVIQTVDPENPVLKLAAKQDYASFYAQEIQFRKLNLYPPFCTICMVGFSGAEDAEVFAAAVAFSRAVQNETKRRGDIPLRVLGPAPMNIAMVNHHYRYKLTLKCRNNMAFRTMLGTALEQYNRQDLPRKAAVFLDFYSDADI